MSPLPIASMRNLGPRMQSWLAEIDVHAEDDLRKLGSIEAWHRLRFVFGNKVSIIALYAMEAALIGCDWRHLPHDVKATLQQAGQRLIKPVKTVKRHGFDD